MNLFQFTEEQNMLREMVREFVNAEIKPIAAAIDENEEIPRDLITKIGELGLLGTVFPEEYGGGGFGEVGYCIAQEEVGRGCLSTATLIGAHMSIGTNAIYLGGTDELKQKYLPKLCSGEWIGAFGLTEAMAGSDSFNVRTRAVDMGDHYLLNGEKLWITNGGIADVISVFARTERGVTALAVETAWEGFSAGPKEKKMGIRGSMTNPISFKDVRVPKENLIGQDGRGFLIAMKTLDAGRLGLGACCVGAAKEMIELSSKYAKERKQFDAPIANFEGVQFMLAEMWTLVYAMESVVYRTAADYDAGKKISTQSAAVKLFCSEGLDKVVDLAVQIHGGMGYSRELPVERFYRDSRINRIFEGTSEIQKLVISHDVLRRNGMWAL
ncbi:MAG: acyl-CoA dehydrogenase family protein [Bacteroidia bacterium]|nr:acyl-CoA dehydrogenase family protein [Bacteroidia bacterium]